MTKSLYENVLAEMRGCGVQFEETRHEPVFTSEAASHISGHPEEQGTKSLVLQTSDKKLVVVTVCGDERIDFNGIKKLLGVKKVKMCDDQLLPDQLGTELGGVSPFGYSTSTGISLVVSPRLFLQEFVYFNGGQNDVTFRVTGSGFKKLMESCNSIIAIP